MLSFLCIIGASAIASFSIGAMLSRPRMARASPSSTIPKQEKISSQGSLRSRCGGKGCDGPTWKECFPAYDHVTLSKEEQRQSDAYDKQIREAEAYNRKNIDNYVHTPCGNAGEPCETTEDCREENTEACINICIHGFCN